MAIKNSFRTFELRFCDGSVINDWLSECKKLLEGTSEILLKHSNELFTYLIKDGREELKIRRLRLLELESEKLKAKLARISREKFQLFLFILKLTVGIEKNKCIGL